MTSSSGSAITLTVGDNNSTTTFSGTIEDGAGTVALTKIGTGTLTLSGNNTYTDVTDVQAGTLVLDGNVNSLISDHGGTVSGWFFRDPDLAAAAPRHLAWRPTRLLLKTIWHS